VDPADDEVVATPDHRRGKRLTSPTEERVIGPIEDS